MKFFSITIAAIALCTAASAQSKKAGDSTKAPMEWKKQKPDRKGVPDTSIIVIPSSQKEVPVNPNVPTNALPERKPAPNTDLIIPSANGGVPKK